MKPATILLVGLVMTVGAFAAVLYVAAIVFIVSGIALTLILGGTLIPVHSRTGRLVFPAADPGAVISHWPCLENQKLDPHKDHRIDFGIETRGFGLLAATGGAAIYVIGLVLARHGNPFRPYANMDTGEYVLFYALAFASFIPLGIAGRWFVERKRLAWSMLALGGLEPLTGAYTFCDQNGIHYGGTKKPILPKPQDNMCVVFYAPKNPDASTSSAGLMFHRLRLLAPSCGDAG